ncbi:MAG: plastocyanin/azurin family copper-binding protein [Dehalococcoidia bacterium]
MRSCAVFLPFLGGCALVLGCSSAGSSSVASPSATAAVASASSPISTPDAPLPAVATPTPTPLATPSAPPLLPTAEATPPLPPTLTAPPTVQPLAAPPAVATPVPVVPTSTPAATPAPEVSPPPAPRPAPLVRHTVIQDLSFESVIEVPAGSTVVWTNVDGLAHTVTSTDPMLDSPFLSTGDSYSITFPQAGVFSYFCRPHLQMTATIIVVD